MFDLCFQITIIATKKLKILKVWLKVPTYINIYIGRRKAAVILERDTILVKLITIKNVPKDATPTFQESAINIPNPVATALPPFPFNHIGQMCPVIANSPART